ARRKLCTGVPHAFRRVHVPHRLFDADRRAGAGLRGARVRVVVGARALAHPALAQVAVSRRRRAAENVLRRDGPVRDPDRRRRRDQDLESRHRRLPGDPARHDPDREGGGLARSGLRRPVPLRHRRRLEPGRDGGPRHRFRLALQADARTGRGDARNLDQVEARIPRRYRRLPADDDLAKTQAEPAPDHRRRRFPACGAAGGALRQRLDSDRRARDLRQFRRLLPRIQKDAGRGRPQPHRRADHDVRRRARSRPVEEVSRPRGRASRRRPVAGGRRQGAAGSRPMGRADPPGQRLGEGGKMPDIKIVADGLGFPEGPVWMADGSVILGEISGKKVTRVAPDGKKTEIGKAGGGPNGVATGPDGALYVCNNGGAVYETTPSFLSTGPAPDYNGGSIQRIDPKTGETKTLYTEANGHRLSAPNDIVFDKQGGFYFTDLGKRLAHHRDNG